MRRRGAHEAISADLAPPRITHGEDIRPDRRPHPSAVPSNCAPTPAFSVPSEAAA